ncbi:transcription elongation factor GreA [Kingella kingae ATCC 23330]|uniref:Transcription elongation factor GreA n=2 Tax=Kingella kingae TaxID=504 RepID=F5S4V6_KINKI|nr:transcription elongation factor GreA [Kingella kingae ATCC 23330]
MIAACLFIYLFKQSSLHSWGYFWRTHLIMKKIPLTVHGAERLKAELQQLKSVARPEVIAAIAEARSHGDLSENAEYEAAKDRQGFIEGRIAELENKLSHAQIIDPKEIHADGKIVFGATVNLMDLDSDEESCYQIVGDDEADIKLFKISVNSPIARALIGKEEGDVAEVQAPSGIREYEILTVQYI